MHICLDFIPELLRQPSLEKQIFACELVSYLSIQYALPKSLGIARLALDVMSTLLSVLTSAQRVEFYMSALPALVRICRAFPPLCEDAISLLTQIGRVCRAHLAAKSLECIPNADTSLFADLPRDGQVQRKGTPPLTDHSELLHEVNQTFSSIVQSAQLLKPLHLTQTS